MYGEGAQAAVVNRVGVSFLVDYGRTSATNINNAGHNLVLSTYMGGVRYSIQRGEKFSPYGQVLVGTGHTSSNYAIDADIWRLAASVGGGLNVRLSRRVDFRPVEAQYLLTRIPNAVNEIQNQLRLSSGLVFHFSRH
jgi:peptidoglycan-associated lipoprotein